MGGEPHGAGNLLADHELIGRNEDSARTYEIRSSGALDEGN